MLRNIDLGTCASWQEHMQVNFIVSEDARILIQLTVVNSVYFLNVSMKAFSEFSASIRK
jgi:hypothetical protein